MLPRAFLLLGIVVVLGTLLGGADAWWWSDRRRRRRRRVNCGYNNWQRWSGCSRSCSVGTQYRRRYIYRWPCCGGWGCPSTYNWRYCGRYNGGCQQICRSGRCSCYSGYYQYRYYRCFDINECSAYRPCNHYCHNTVGSYYCSCKYGYKLGTNRRTCYPVDCKRPATPKACPSHTYTDGFGPACRPVYIPGCRTTYLNRCYLRCPSYYKLATYSVGGYFMQSYSSTRWQYISNVQCQGNARWTSYSTLPRLYCRRQNDPPSSLRLSSTSLNENSQIGTKIGTLSSTDPQSGQRFTYTLQPGGRSTGYYLFRISGTSLLSRFVPRLNVNNGITSSGKFIVNIRTTDNGLPNMFRQQEFTIKILNVNDPPENIQLRPWAISESANSGSYVGTLSAFDPDIPTDANPCSRWFLRDSSNGFFKLSGNKVYTAKSLNHEAQNFHSINVVCYDKQRGTLATSQKLVIDVQDAKDPPISVTLDKTSIDENSALNTLVGTVTALDEDDEPLTITMSDDISMNKVAASKVFQLGATTCKDEPNTLTHSQRKRCTAPLTVKGSLDFETGAWYRAFFWARDSTPSHLHRVVLVNITVKDVNERPTDIDMDTTSIPENSPGGSLVSDFDVTDPDNSVDLVQRPTCTLGTSGDNLAFDIEGQSPNYELAVKKGVTLDYETKNTYIIKITCADHGLPVSLSYSKSFTIRVTDVNESPTNITLSNNVVAENSAVGTPVGYFGTIDPDRGNTFTYKLIQGVTPVPFKIVGNQLQVNGSIDFETEDDYVIVVSSTDQGGLEVIDDFSINITDVPEGPTKVYLDGQHTLPEDARPGDLVGNIIVIDQDFNQLPTCAVVQPDASNGVLTLAGTGNDELVKGSAAIDYETMKNRTVRIDVKCTDPDGLGKTATFYVNVTNVNEPPTNITIDNHDVPENSFPTVIGQLTVIDPDKNQSHNCSVQDNPGTVAAGRTPETKLFAVTPSLKLETIAPLDFEGGVDTYLVHILCVDHAPANQTSYVIEQDILVNVTDVNEPPTSPCNNTWYVNEMEKNNTAITAPLNAYDPDNENGTGKQQLTYTILNPGSVPFKLSTSTNEIMKDGWIDYEHIKSYTIRIRVTDDGELRSGDTMFQGTPLHRDFSCLVKVVDKNDPHASHNIRLVPPKPCMDEHTTTGTVIATAYTDDVDANATHTYKIVGSTPPVKMVGNKLVATDRASTDIDFEQSSNDIQIVIASTDAHNHTVQRAFSVCVRNVNENATKMCLITGSASIAENQPAGTPITQIVVEDPDDLPRTCGPPVKPYLQNPITYRCSIQDTTGDGFYNRYFYMNDQLQILCKQPLDYEFRSVYYVEVLCQDKKEPINIIKKTFKISVTNVNEAPTNLGVDATASNLPYSVTSGVTTVNVPERKSMINVLFFTCQDPDYPGVSTAAIIQYSAGGTAVDDGTFEMRGNTLVLLKPLDFEKKSKYTITITATDNGQPAKSTKITVIVNVVDSPDLPTQINLLCRNGAEFPFKNSTTAHGSHSSQHIIQTTPSPVSWPTTINPRPGLQGALEDCSIINTNQITSASVFVVGQVYPTDQDASKWYEFSLGGRDADYFVLYPYGVRHQSVYTHSALLLLNSTVDPVQFTLGSPAYSIFIDVHDNFGKQQIGHLMTIQARDVCYMGKKTCAPVASCLVTLPAATSYTCKCPPNSIGDGTLSGTGCTVCEAGWMPSNGVCKNINECASNPCKNSATCRDLVNSYRCECPAGYSGTHCETHVDTCANNAGLCENGGSCFDTLGAPRCMCAVGYTGSNCHYLTASCTDFPTVCGNGVYYCAHTPHVGSLEGKALCVHNGDLNQLLLTGVPPELDIYSKDFKTVAEGYVEEVLGAAQASSKQFEKTFEKYSRDELGLTVSAGRRRRSTLSDKAFLAQLMNMTDLGGRKALISVVVLVKANLYSMTSPYKICPLLQYTADMWCATEKDCVLLRQAHLVCGVEEYNPDRSGDGGITGYIHAYNPEQGCTGSNCEQQSTGSPAEQANPRAVKDDKSFFETTPGIVILVVAGLALIGILIVLFTVRRRRNNILRKMDDQVSFVSDTNSLSGGIGFHHDSRASVGGVTNPVYSESSVQKPDYGRVEEDNMAYDVAGGLSPLYETLPGDQQ